MEWMLLKYMENVLYKYTCLTVFVFFFLPNKSAFQNDQGGRSGLSNMISRTKPL